MLRHFLVNWQVETVWFNNTATQPTQPKTLDINWVDVSPSASWHNWCSADRSPGFNLILSPKPTFHPLRRAASQLGKHPRHVHIAQWRLQSVDVIIFLLKTAPTQSVAYIFNYPFYFEVTASSLTAADSNAEVPWVPLASPLPPRSPLRKLWHDVTTGTRTRMESGQGNLRRHRGPRVAVP